MRIFTFCRRSLEFYDLLPDDPKLYDKMRPPKKDGQATVVYFHVTVMGLDSIDENSMVGFLHFWNAAVMNFYLLLLIKFIQTDLSNIFY